MVAVRRSKLKVAGLFAGIGGLELGMAASGHHTQLLVENAPPAMHVLRRRFPDTKLEADVRDLSAAAEPAPTSWSRASPARTSAASGARSESTAPEAVSSARCCGCLQQSDVPWVVLENVPFLMSLGQGAALRLITTALTELGYRWAYRVVDSNAFGLPQRRNRWYLVASRVGDPRDVLLADDVEKPIARRRIPRRGVRLLLDRGHARVRLGRRRRAADQVRVLGRRRLSPGHPAAVGRLRDTRICGIPNGCRAFRPTGRHPPRRSPSAASAGAWSATR